MEGHVSVMRDEVVRLLAFEGEGWIVDGTLGAGGHAAALLDASPKAKLVGLDIDPESLETAKANLARFGTRVIAVASDYADMGEVMESYSIPPAKAILLDLGFSSLQMSSGERGFSFSARGPLDMRYDRASGVPLSRWLEEIDAKDLARIIREYGEKRYASWIAKALKARIARGELRDTAELANAIASAIPRKHWPRNIDPATRTFQALRIAINDELGRLERFLGSVPGLLEVGGRMAVISFHSLEDRRVKSRFGQLSATCTCPPELPVCRCGKTPAVRLLTRGALKPSEEEIAANPKARSAKLRAVERIN